MKRLLLFFTITLQTTLAIAQNIDCSDAIPIAIDGACATNVSIEDSIESGPSISSDACSSNVFKNEGWFSFNVTSGPQLISITANASNRDVYLQLISASSACTDLALIECSDEQDMNSNDPNSENLITTLENGLYYIKVISVYGGNPMNLTSLCVEAPTFSDNDTCLGAYEVPVSTTNCSTEVSATTDIENVSATADTYNCGFSDDDDVWFYFTALSSEQTITVTSTDTPVIEGNDPISNFAYSLFEGNCGSLSYVSLSCETGGINDTSSNTITGLVTGQTYFVKVFSRGSGNGAKGEFTICVTSPPLSPSDVCSTATEVAINTQETCNNGGITGNTASAAPSNYPVTCQVGGSANPDDIFYDRWYYFIPTNSALNIDVVQGSIEYVSFELFKGDCNGLELIACVDEENNADETFEYTQFETTETYYVRVFSERDNANYQGTFNLCITTDTSLSNDNYHLDANNVSISSTGNMSLKITSINTSINTISVYDITGKTILTDNDINNSTYVTDFNTYSSGLYLAKITLIGGKQIIKKFAISQ